MVFREKLPRQDVAITFNDVILIPDVTCVEPIDVDVSTKVSKNIQINIPIVSSPMDTVTEFRLAIQLARLGGIGIIHRNLTIDEQIEHVIKVKESQPFNIHFEYIKPNDDCFKILKLFKDLGVENLPVIDDYGKFLGIVSKSDVIRNLNDKVYKIVRGVKSLDPLCRVEDIKKYIQETGLDIVVFTDNQGHYKGFTTIWDIYYEKPFIPVIDDEGKLRVGAAVSPFDYERMLKLCKYVDLLVIDVAHVANKKIIESLKKIEKDINIDLVIGNLGTYNCTVEVITKLEKIDSVRVGIASGSICSTGVITGIAAPTLWAIAQVADALYDYGLKSIPVIADGGIKNPGDAVKAFTVGAWCIMLGRILASTLESPSPVIIIGNKKYKYYRGMASESARAKRFAIDRYGRKVKDISEGVEGLVPYRGTLEQVVKEFVSGIQASMGYIGARNIPEVWIKGKLMLVTELGRKEIEPHSIYLQTQD